MPLGDYTFGGFNFGENLLFTAPGIEDGFDSCEFLPQYLVNNTLLFPYVCDVFNYAIETYYTVDAVKVQEIYNTQSLNYDPDYILRYLGAGDWVTITGVTNSEQQKGTLALLVSNLMETKGTHKSLQFLLNVMGYGVAKVYEWFEIPEEILKGNPRFSNRAVFSELHGLTVTPIIGDVGNFTLIIVGGGTAGSEFAVVTGEKELTLTIEDGVTTQTQAQTALESIYWVESVSVASGATAITLDGNPDLNETTGSGGVTTSVDPCTIVVDIAISEDQPFTLEDESVITTQFNELKELLLSMCVELDSFRFTKVFQDIREINNEITDDPSPTNLTTTILSGHFPEENICNPEIVVGDRYLPDLPLVASVGDSDPDAEVVEIDVLDTSTDVDTGLDRLTVDRIWGSGEQVIPYVNKSVVQSTEDITMPGAIATGTDQITVATDYQTGSAIKLTFSSGATLPSPLLDNTIYYAIRINATTIQLADTYADAVNTNPIDITTAGSGTITLDFLGSLPSPLIEGAVYFAIYINATTIELASTYSEAVAGTPIIDLTTTGDGSMELVKGPLTDDMVVHLTIDYETINYDGIPDYIYDEHIGDSIPPSELPRDTEEPHYVRCRRSFLYATMTEGMVDTDYYLWHDYGDIESVGLVKFTGASTVILS